MCLSPTCDCLDDCCCPFPEKAKFFGYWTFGSGIYVMWFQYILFQSASDTLNVPQIAFQAVLDCIQMAAGICILIGVYRKIPSLYLTGLILSWILPVVVFYIIILLVMQIVFFIPCIRWYCREFKDTE